MRPIGLAEGSNSSTSPILRYAIRKPPEGGCVYQFRHGTILIGRTPYSRVFSTRVVKRAMTSASEWSRQDSNLLSSPNGISRQSFLNCSTNSATGPKHRPFSVQVAGNLVFPRRDTWRCFQCCKTPRRLASSAGQGGSLATGGARARRLAGENAGKTLASIYIRKVFARAVGRYFPLDCKAVT